jgi:hypothetical protein
MPSEIIWSPTALDHLQAIYEYILPDNPAAALDVHEESSALRGCYRIIPAWAIQAGWRTPESLLCLNIPPASSCTSYTGAVFISWPSCTGGNSGLTVSKVESFLEGDLTRQSLVAVLERDYGRRQKIRSELFDGEQDGGFSPRSHAK